MKDSLWISVSDHLPNDDEVPYNWGRRAKNRPNRSDRVLAVDKNGFIMTGYFLGSSCMEHDSTPGKRWEFGDHHFYNGSLDTGNIWSYSGYYEPIAWMPLPEIPFIKEELHEDTESNETQVR